MSWIPIASRTDLIPRHVFQAKLRGQELAIWRADDGNVNIWENRCLHRGVRLTIGVNTGSELVCQYHGWRYANRSAGCTYIPAHPADAPARTICNRTYPVLEQDGMIWTHTDASEPDHPSALQHLAQPSAQTDQLLVLRALPIHASPQLVEQQLPALLGRKLKTQTEYGELHLFIQPVDSDRVILRGALSAPQGTTSDVLRHFNRMFTHARTALESEASRQPTPAPIAPDYAKVSAELAEMPALATGPAGLRVTIASKTMVADEICSLELAPLKGTLPTFQPGAHIDVSLPNGMVRQYSLINAPGETDRYVIGVKRDAQSAGGSMAIHNDLHQGDLLSISAPHNTFPLRRDATKSLLIAGGIGVTPLLSMAAALQVDQDPFAFHYFAQTPDHMAFPDRLARLGNDFFPETGLSNDQTKARLSELLAAPKSNQQIYVCGPAPMLQAVREIARHQGWPDHAVHFEYFKNTRTIDTSSTFEISLARSAQTLTVPSGQSILSVLRENGIAMPASCEQGACGTCMATVLEGAPDHQDVYLNQDEQAAGQKIMTCVSRAKSKRLVLDL
jgi:ferredoxin-NADP reductase/nitrite reductase/ring-hydroxylating ferredoxin subunit